MSDRGTHEHMSPDEFRQHGRQVVDWIADYLATVENRAVLSRVEPGEIRSHLPTAPPASGEPIDAIMADLDSIIMPGITHWQSPNFFGFFPANSSGPSLLGDFISSGLGVQGMSWATSPACTELETHVLDWLVRMLGLPEQFLSSSRGGGVIQDTASSATLCAMLAGREQATGFDSNKSGNTAPLVAYTSAQAHSSVEKAIRIAGIGATNLRLIDVDSNFAMRSDALHAAMDQDIKAGLQPFFVCATVGTTSSNAMDPVRAIAEVCLTVSGPDEPPIWLHVDAAMSGTAALCPEFRWIQDGLELADSYCFNPHKWMFTNFDCDCFWVRDRAVLIRTLSILPEYLRNKPTESGEVFDYRDWQVPLGRRFRALKLWFVIRHYGVEGLQHHVREDVRLAQEFAQWVRADPDFELVVEPPLNLVCFRHVRGNEINEQIMTDLNRSGRLYLTHTKLNDLTTLRMSIGQTSTERRHIELAWNLIRGAASGS